MTIAVDQIATVWRVMGHLYGAVRWAREYGEFDAGLSAAAGTWWLGLRDLMPVMIERGLAACVRRGDGWLPTLPEFRSMCLGITEGEIEAEIEQRVGEYDYRRLTVMELVSLRRALRPDVVRSIEAHRLGTLPRVVSDPVSSDAPGGVG